jgi:hypothetical protein
MHHGAVSADEGRRRPVYDWRGEATKHFDGGLQDVRAGRLIEPCLSHKHGPDRFIVAVGGRASCWHVCTKTVNDGTTEHRGRELVRIIRHARIQAGSCKLPQSHQ